MSRKQIIISIAAAAALLVLIIGNAAWNALCDNKRHNFRAQSVLLVYPDMSVRDVEKTMFKDNYVVRRGSIRRVFRQKKVAKNLKPGRYVIHPSYTSVYVARMLNNGWQTPLDMVVSGMIRTKESLAHKISTQMMVDSVTVMNALYDTALLSKYGFDTVNVFSLVIPDTYQMYWTASMDEIFGAFKKQYDAFWNTERRGLAKDEGLTPLQVSTMASIVSGESRYEPEFPSIAGVYLNRLHRGMRLQADPTVAYCFGYKLNRIRKGNLEVDSPYNTYKNYGLPPGPICVPSKACIDAVLKPDSHGYLYFCASPSFNGTHVFATDFAGHERNARAFQKAMDQRNIN